MLTNHKTTAALMILLLCGACGAPQDPVDDEPTMPGALTGTSGADDDDEPPADPPSSEEPADDEPAGSSTGGEGPGPDPDPPSGSSSDTGEEPGPSTGEQDGALAVCLDEAVNECEVCACNNCLDELTACGADPGCVEIRVCAQQTGCTGLDCLNDCGDVIDGAGGPLGASAGLALMVSDCYEALGCNNRC